jgi:glycerol-3-phosphate dehydrogenase
MIRLRRGAAGPAPVKSGAAGRRHAPAPFQDMPTPIFATSPGRDGSNADMQEFDLLVIGGGINGVGIARDAAGRGLSVLLCDKGDLSGGTSSRSSRLIHGGLRYLEYGEFRLVREALRERETLLRIAPHLVRPMRFVLPQVPGMRPAWMLRAGLFLYDHLAPRQRLAPSAAIELDRVPEGAAVRPQIRRGFVYSDCHTDDSRLVLANAISAQRLGAIIRTRTELLRAQRDEAGRWRAQLHDLESGARSSCTARGLVNAAGPWIEAVGARIEGTGLRPHARLVQGSHIVVSRFWDGDHAYLLQHTDRRVIFAAPYEPGFAMIGTTELPCSGTPEQAGITPTEIDYLCCAVNRQLRCQLAPADVRHAYSGVRCLVDDERDSASAVTRDYRIEHEVRAGQAPYLVVLGGKVTTFRRLGEHALELLQAAFPKLGPAWTGRQPLPGGELPGGDRDAAESDFLSDFAFLPAHHARSLFDRHGSEARRLLAGISSLAAMGRHFGAGLYECEAQHFVREEWARSAQDILWRRTKCGLQMTPEQATRLQDWIEHARPGQGT